MTASNAQIIRQIEKHLFSIDARLERIESADLATLKAERDEARTLAEEACARLNREQKVLRCAFCSAEYPPDTPATQHSALTEHVKVCPKHPMWEAERERDEAVALLRRCSEELAGVTNFLPENFSLRSEARIGTAIDDARRFIRRIQLAGKAHPAPSAESEAT